jgi:hypothetical protein
VQLCPRSNFWMGARRVVVHAEKVEVGFGGGVLYGVSLYDDMCGIGKVRLRLG